MECFGSPIELGRIAKSFPSYLKGYDKIFILTDSNTLKYCLPATIKVLKETTVRVMSVDAGEVSKSLETCNYLWERLSEEGATRSSLLVNLGGGVITDLGGMVASLYMRGIDFIHIPTSLLAMTDAAIGGKTGINFLHLKNYLGTFSPAKAILVDPIFLKTLPRREYLSGLAESIKHGLIASPALFEHIELQGGATSVNEQFLIQSLQVKVDIVSSDPLEKNVRKKLNFGHTIGHALESLAMAEDDPLTHGEAVAIGMLLEAYLSRRVKGLSEGNLNRIKEVIMKVYCKRDLSFATAASLNKFIAGDKKNSSRGVGFTLLEAIGRAHTDIPVSAGMVSEALDYYHHIS